MRDNILLPLTLQSLSDKHFSPTLAFSIRKEKKTKQNRKTTDTILIPKRSAFVALPCTGTSQKVPLQVQIPVYTVVLLC